MSTINHPFEIRPYSLTELSAIYGVTNRTMKNWIKPHEKEIGVKVGRLYTTLQVKIIFMKLGLPGKADD
jgi:hypothetical protein